MRILLLAVVGVIAVALLLRWFLRSSPAAMARRVRQIGGLVALGAAAVLTARGAIQLSGPLAALGLWLLAQSGGRGGFGPVGPREDQTSHIVTDHLEMRLDLETGRVSGRVLKGLFKGREIERLKPEELALLWQDCRIADPQSAQILEAYLDQTHPNWREDVKRGEERFSGGADGRMRVEEAYEILGLELGATAEQVRKAHRELMLRLHPDRGGSTYLSAKINEAKDVLLASLEG
ncbi:MAG: DnaJ domain-containing protein [Hyphomicrobiaceae bacterium]|nr:DnaJ domain-containing protein [Hyphomicrobiaceae bacterium]